MGGQLRVDYRVFASGRQRTGLPCDRIGLDRLADGDGPGAQAEDALQVGALGIYRYSEASACASAGSSAQERGEPARVPIRAGIRRRVPAVASCTGGKTGILGLVRLPCVFH